MLRSGVGSALLLLLAFSTAHAQDPTTGRPWNYASTTPPPKFVSQCACSDYKNIWLDVMLIIDSSLSMTEHGIEELSNYLLTALGRMNIGQGIGHYTRIGAVTYGSSAALQFKLTSFNSYSQMLDQFDPSLDGTTGSNIEAGLRLAQSEFDSQGHRNNTVRVIVLAASHYEAGSSVDPVQTATQFKEDGGILITLEYVQEHGAVVPILSTLATPCFSLTNKNEDLHANDLLDLFCKANCFCRAQWQPYSLDAQCGTPTGGCYYQVLIPSAQTLAERYCVRHFNATLPKIENANKAVFINSLFKNKQQRTWIGLEYKPSAFGYRWEDGSAVSGYSPFAAHNYSVSCVTQQQGSGFTSKWWPTDCVDDHLYTCQTSPCSADQYCS